MKKTNQATKGEQMKTSAITIEEMRLLAIYEQKVLEAQRVLKEARRRIIDAAPASVGDVVFYREPGASAEMKIEKIEVLSGCVYPVYKATCMPERSSVSTIISERVVYFSRRDQIVIVSRAKGCGL